MTRLNLFSLVLLLGVVPGIFTGLTIAAWLLFAAQVVGLVILTVVVLAYYAIGAAYLVHLTR